MFNFAILRSKKGFGLVETMVAASIIAISAVGITQALRELGKNRERLLIMSNAIQFEGELTRALLNENSYSDTAMLDMRQGTVPSGLSFNIAVPSGTVGVGTGGASYFTKDFTPTAATSPDRVYTVEIDVTQTATGTFAYAYVINISPRGSTEMSPLGIKTGTTFSATDYRLTIPTKVYSTTSGTSNSSQCLPPSATLAYDDMAGIAMHGVSFGIGSLITCAQDPVLPDTCNVDTLMKDIRYLPTNSFDPICSDEPEFPTPSAPKTMACPNEYLMQNYSPASLDNSPVFGQCVFVTERNPVPANPALHTFESAVGTESVGGVVCPPNYRVDAGATTCTAINPVVSGATPMAGVPTLSVSGASATCTIVFPTQNCANSATAQARMVVRCVLDVPEVVSAF